MSTERNAPRPGPPPAGVKHLHENVSSGSGRVAAEPQRQARKQTAAVQPGNGSAAGDETAQQKQAAWRVGGKQPQFPATIVAEAAARAKRRSRRRKNNAGKQDVAASVAEAQAGSGRRRRRRGGRRRRKPGLPECAIVFVGPMAAGKTSLGKRVARELGVPFVDTDVIFTERHGQITDFFSAHGEAAFRRIEEEIVAEQLAIPGTRVLALGGGAVLSALTRERLRGFPVVLLMTTQEAVLRTVNIQKRPLLRDNPEAWQRILDERRPHYEEVAKITFRTDRATRDQLAVRVSRWARGWRGGLPSELRAGQPRQLPEHPQTEKEQGGATA